MLLSGFQSIFNNPSCNSIVPFVSIAKQYKKHSKALNKVFSECASSGQYILGDKVEQKGSLVEA